MKQLKIGSYELSEEESKRVNEIISKFLVNKHEVLEGFSPKTGRSAAGKQFCLNVNNIRYVSVKLEWDSPENILWELFHANVRQILCMPHYKVIKEKDFPLPNWKDQEYIIMDWGPKDGRFHLADEHVQESLNQNKLILLSQFGNVAAQNYLFATSDRKKEHFVWDLTDKNLFSIDHEIPTNNADEVTNYFRSELKALNGNNWYDDEDMKKTFTNSFMIIWQNAEKEQNKILQNYVQNGLEKYSGGFLERLKLGSQSALQRVMS